MRVLLQGRRAASLLAGLVLLGPVLGGCALIDQRTFGAPPPPPKRVLPGTVAPAAAALPIDPRTPLVRITYATPDPVYRPMLDYAVRAALARRPNVVFDVMALSPPAKPPAKPPAAKDGKANMAQAKNAQPVAAPKVEVPAPAASAGPADAATVMRAIMALGVPASRIHLVAASDPGVSTPEVRVYVR